MWQVLPGQSLRHRSWGDESVLYNDLTGDTHLLGANAMAVLLALQPGPLALPALCQGLDAADSASVDAVAAILSELELISLVEDCAC